VTPGTLVAGRYAVLRALGEGGMGQVYEVQHKALGRRFALKVLRADLVNAVLVRRFEREAQSLARVSTARVAQVTDFGIDPDLGPFYVMELLEGETLGDRLDREGRLSVAESAEIAIEIAEALVEVHAAAIVHRDLKPSNVGLPVRGPVKAKLLDFGLAAVLEGGNPRLTKSQELLGSLPYMAPEQFMGEPPTPAIDLYALGICTYEMLTGRLPFEADSSAALMRQILTQPVPPLDDPRFGVTVPGPLAAVVLRLLAHEPGARYASAQAAAQALRAAAVGPSREKTLKENEESAMPRTRATPGRSTAPEALAPTEESPSLPPPGPAAAGEAATLLVAASVMSAELPAQGDAPAGDTWRSGPPADVLAAEAARARADRKVPSTSEVPAAIRTTSMEVAGLRGGRRTVLWAAGIAAIAGVVVLVAWLARGPGASAPDGPPVRAVAAPAIVAEPTPAPGPALVPPAPIAPAALPEGVSPPAPEAAEAVAPVTPVGAPLVGAPSAAGPPATPAQPRARRTGPTKRRGGPRTAGQWTGEVIDEP